MALLPIQTENIKYDTEFHGYLYRNHNKNPEDLYAVMEKKNFNISELHAEKQRRVIAVYYRFVKIKEHWFGAPKGVHHGKPVTREAIINWVNQPDRIVFYGNASEYGQNRNYAQTLDRIRAQAADKITSVLDNMANELPEVVRTLILKRNDFQIVIFPKDEIILKNVEIGGKIIKEYNLEAGAAYMPYSQLMLIKEDSLFKDESWRFNNKIRHEFYHVFDCAAVDTSINGVTDSRRAKNADNVLSLSEVLNERLKEKKLTNSAVKTLDEIAAAESLKMKKFNRICDADRDLTNILANGSPDILSNFMYDEMNKKIEKLKAEHHIWVPTINVVDKQGEFKIAYAEGGDENLNKHEILAYALQAYYNGSRAALKKYNPALYDIIVTEVIPILRDIG